MKDKDRKAVALKYERGRDAAPKITAKGRGAVADKILAWQGSTAYPSRRTPPSWRPVPPGPQRADPEELYQIVAEILAFIYRMNALKKGRG
jgi:flagellar biosynthesis protein